MVYPDSVLIDTFSGSVKSLQIFILILFQLKIIQDLCWLSLNQSMVYPDSVSINTFSGSDKLLQIFNPILFELKIIQDLFWFSLNDQWFILIPFR